MGSVSRSTTIQASPDRVWSAIRDFHDLSWAPGIVTECKPLGDAAGTEPGAQRVVNGVFAETLLESDPQERRLRFSVDDGPSPVSANEVTGLEAKIQVRAGDGDGMSVVEWSAGWREGDDEEIIDTLSGVFDALLGEMKRYVEGLK